MSKIEHVIDNLCFKYELDDVDKADFLNMTKNIRNHYGFKKRFKKSFKHHGNISLSEHLLEDAIKTYVISKKIKDDGYDIKVAVTIAMLHDLYVLPWQNSKIKCKSFFNKHGFRHPVEAAINAINWFPELFVDDNKAEKIIDGIIHHMYPLPVSRFVGDEINSAELQNFNKVKNISKKHLNMIINSTKRGMIGKVSFAKPKYKEGKVVSLADKRVSRTQFDGVYEYTTLITGENKRLKFD